MKSSGLLALGWAAPAAASDSAGAPGAAGSWWDDAGESPELQDRIYDGLSGAYGLIAVQLARIQLRVPEYGWTTQKVFHLLNFLCAGLRCGVFACRQEVDTLQPAVWRHVLLDLPGLLFFSTYTLLVLFWAEIYHQARSLSTAALRPAFLGVNAGVYGVQAGVWLYLGASGGAHLVPKVSSLFLAAVNVTAAAGFLVYGGRLFVMLRRFPIESKGRRKKLREVGAVTAVCTTCFTTRAAFVAYAAFHRAFAARLDVVSHPLLNCVYYGAVEVLPAALVLYILRKLPPKRPAMYAAVPSGPVEPQPQDAPPASTAAGEAADEAGIA